jgi:hypothetical protein
MDRLPNFLPRSLARKPQSNRLRALANTEFKMLRLCE